MDDKTNMKICTECKTKIGPWGCCGTIRKLSRQVAHNSTIAKQAITSIRDVMKHNTLTKYDSTELEKIINDLRKLI